MTDNKLKISILSYSWFLCIVGSGIMLLGLYIAIDELKLISLILFVPFGALLFLIGFNVIKNYSLKSIKTLIAISMFFLLFVFSDAIEQIVSKWSALEVNTHGPLSGLIALLLLLVTYQILIKHVSKKMTSESGHN